MERSEKDYDKKKIKERLEPYLDYLKSTHKHYKNPIGFGWKRRPQHRPTDTQNPNKSPTTGNRDEGVWIMVRGLSPEYERYLFKPDQVQEISDDEPDRAHWKQSPKIKIIDRNAETVELRLERIPKAKKPCIFRNTYSIQKQIQAIKDLIHKPDPERRVLLNLFLDRDKVDLGNVKPRNVDRWFVLTEERPGVEQQREFVRRALGTPDFAFLEGPPGSGKTTTLCELVHQLVAEGKRVLFCASTHVAVDNLLEKIAPDCTVASPDSDLIPLRIGISEKISAAISCYQYNKLADTIGKQIRTHLSKQKHKTGAQRALLDVIKDTHTIGDIARDCTNLVCGTTAGILQYTDIKKGGPNRMFDVMILDEASKTTFQEFLVPALYARRWIIVGDTRQLAPHTDQEEIGLHVGACIGEPEGTVCTDAFLAGCDHTVMAVAGADLKWEYFNQCEKLGVKLHDADASPGWTGTGIVVGSARSLSGMDAGVIRGMLHKRLVKTRRRRRPPGVDTTVIGGTRSRPNIVVRHRDQILDELDGTTGKAQAWRAICREEGTQDDMTWDRQVTWRLITLSGSGLSDSRSAKTVGKDLDRLMPYDPKCAKYVEQGLDKVKKIAFPSILELLQYGYELQDDTTIMTRGMPQQDFEKRRVLLEWQHRMHPEIARFSRKYVYEKKALGTPKYMRKERDWTYTRYENRMVWIDVTDRDRTNYSSPAESERIADEIRIFSEWARDNPKPDAPWRIAILSFYTNQVERMRRRLKEGGFAATDEYSFSVNTGTRELARVDVRTVDSFQGHEADVVFLSVARQHPTPFLENRNRLNVALTRARYQNVIVGNRYAMKKSKSLMGKLAHHASTHRTDADG